MRMIDIIEKKRDGLILSKKEIEFFVNGYVKSEIPDYQVSALLMAIYLNGLNESETSLLTSCMAHSGDIMDLSEIDGIKVDKHSTGGVGDKTTFIISPIVASLGVPVAKMSGRGLGHTGGTIDKLESIPHMRTSLTREEFLKTVKKVGLSIISQSGNIVPADKKLYALRDVTGTVDSMQLIAASVMSKKIAAGADCILLDVKTGSGAFMKTLDDSVKLAKTMVSIAKSVGKKAVALITNMDRPLGKAIGNSLEIIEACDTLKGKGPRDLTEISIELAANMLNLADKGPLEVCRCMAREVIKNGKAFDKFKEMVHAQGGDVSVLDNSDAFPKAKVEYTVKAKKSGFIHKFDTERVGIASVILGAGRETKEITVDFTAGIILEKTVGDFVEKDEPLARFYSSEISKCKDAEDLFNQALKISDEEVNSSPLILSRVEN